MSPNRDEQIDRLLAALQGRDDTRASAGCLDAETLAAWMDGALPGPAVSRAEAHAAGCAHCQAMLAAMARTADVPVETQADAAGARSKFWRMLPWAAPLTAVATAAVLYVAVRPEPARSPEADRFSQSSVARSEVPSQPRVDREPETVPPLGAAAEGARRERERQFDTGSAAGRADDAVAATDERGASVSKDKVREKTEIPAPPVLADAQEATRGLKNLSKPAAPAPAPPAEPGQTAAKPAETRLGAAPQAAAAYEQRAAAGAMPAGALAENVTVAVLIPTPDPAVRWRIVGGNIVQLSRDGGATWIVQDTGVQIALRAGSAPAAGVCWIVGGAGTVLRTTNASTWQRIQFPEPVDLVSVTATSADEATVVAADGRTLATTDGGKTWTSP